MALFANGLWSRFLAVLCFAGVLWACSPTPPASEQAPLSSDARPQKFPEKTISSHATASPVVPLLVLEKQHLVAGDAVQRFKQGDQVRLRFRSDMDVELHLHGYDLTLNLKADQPAELNFKAEHAGRFEIELHGHQQAGHGSLGALEIYP